jgi:hypothetical protein
MGQSPTKLSTLIPKPSLPNDTFDIVLCGSLQLPDVTLPFWVCYPKIHFKLITYKLILQFFLKKLKHRNLSLPYKTFLF